MTGDDWVGILILVGFLILVFCMDRLIDADDREAERLDREAADRRYRDERQRLP